MVQALVMANLYFFLFHIWLYILSNFIEMYKHVYSCCSTKKYFTFCPSWESNSYPHWESNCAPIGNRASDTLEEGNSYIVKCNSRMFPLQYITISHRITVCTVSSGA
jgi:hypothetical protein